MNSVVNNPRLPFRFAISGLSAAVLLISTVLVGLYLGIQTQKRFYNVEASWQTYSTQAARRGELLSRIRGHLGYGGIIHNFKNYVLRKDELFLKRLKTQLANFHKTIKEYKENGANLYELGHLDSIESTIKNYEKNLTIAQQAAKENWMPSYTDRLVKVDDTRAIRAMLALDIYLNNQRKAATRSISNAVKEGNDLVKTGLFFLGVLAVVSLILYGMFYLLLHELQQTIKKLSDELTVRRTAELVAKKFQRAVEQSPATIIITDTNQNIEYVNPKFCNLTGYEPAEVIGRTPKFLQSGDVAPDAYADLSEQLQNNKTWRGTFRNLKKDGSSYWAETVILPLRDDTGKISHFIGLGEDVTENKRASEHIARAQKMEAVGLLASGVAHDFNNVLTTILGNVHLAQLDSPDNGDFADELEQIEIAAKRARHLVGQILAFARRQPGKAETLNLKELITEILRLIRASTQPNIQLECDVEDDRLFVHTDTTRLHQVLMNLCSNAAEAIGTKGGKIIIQAHRAPLVAGKQQLVALSVIDDGPGIPQEIQEDIFTPFFTTKQAGKGTGLGLSVVANLVNEMGGEISVYCKESNGCQFKVLLPEAEPEESTLTSTDELIRGSGTILLIDDEPEVAETCANLLQRLNYQVEVYTDPRRAVRKFENDPQRFDLLITDFVMPEMSGKDVCTIIRKIRPECPILIYSAFQPEKLEIEKLAPVNFIEKPFEPAFLAKTVHAMIGTK